MRASRIYSICLSQHFKLTQKFNASESLSKKL
jgi:hypothetical protein